MLVRSLHPRANSRSSKSTDPPTPIPTSQSFIDIPADQYLHSGAPTEWWWHIGALRAGDRVFGFEINAASYVGQGGFGFTQVMLSDVAQNAHYQQTMIYPPGKFDGATWAQSDPTKDWYARMGDPIGGSSYVVMEAPWWQTLTNKSVGALLTDEDTQIPIKFQLLFNQQGAPFIVWGTGVSPSPGTSGDHLHTNNYYYSLTRLQTSGTIELAGEVFEVTGVTWMDHEYGAFTHGGQPVKWTLQDMQLDNGVCISNYFVPNNGDKLVLNQPSPSTATVQTSDGTMYCVPAILTPIERTWTSPKTQQTYFLDFNIEIASFGAEIQVHSLIEAQEFTTGPVYEGVAYATGTFDGTQVQGDAWNEQAP